MSSQRYVIITPARNEGLRIGKTLESVVIQTHRPVRWVIVNDGSTDNTSEIVENYAKKYDFIKLLGVEGSGRKNFGSKVKAFNAGLELLHGLDYNFIGNIDGDISFDPDYFEKLFKEFANNRNLGLGGGIIIEKVDEKLRTQTISINSVAGAVQLFRRDVFERTGGYIPMQFGGVDSAAEIMVRMHGWEVRTFPELKVIHHGPIITGNKNPLRARFNKGIINYTLGYNPLFQVLISLFRMVHRPYILGGLYMILGYFWAKFKKIEQKLPQEAVAFLHSEQIERIKKALCGQRMVVSTK